MRSVAHDVTAGGLRHRRPVCRIWVGHHLVRDDSRRVEAHAEPLQAVQMLIQKPLTWGQGLPSNVLAAEVTHHAVHDDEANIIFLDHLVSGVEEDHLMLAREGPRVDDPLQDCLWIQPEVLGHLHNSLRFEDVLSVDVETPTVQSSLLNGELYGDGELLADL